MYLPCFSVFLEFLFVAIIDCIIILLFLFCLNYLKWVASNTNNNFGWKKFLNIADRSIFTFAEHKIVIIFFVWRYKIKLTNFYTNCCTWSIDCHSTFLLWLILHNNWTRSYLNDAWDPIQTCAPPLKSTLQSNFWNQQNLSNETKPMQSWGGHSSATQIRFWK